MNVTEVEGCKTDVPDAKKRCLLINARLAGTGLYGDPKGELAAGQNSTWRIAPEPFWLPGDLMSEIESLGRHLLAFYQACNRLYTQSVRGAAPDWVREYLEIGKNEAVIDFGRMNRFRSALPGVIRPDLIPTDQGLIATELDSVPGGIGLLGALARLYGELGFGLPGGADGMVAGFERMLRAQAPDVADPLVAIVVSDESADYRNEMHWLAGALRARGLRAHQAHPRDLTFQESGLYLEIEGELQRIDVLYRFFELFDLRNIPKSELILYAARKGLVAMTPPPKHYLEEKLLFALFHHPALQSFWQRNLSKESLSRLRQVIPNTWIVDPRPLPAHAVIPGLTLEGEALQNWEPLKKAGKREREMVLKPSGFSPEAWGSRGVVIGHDVPSEAWSEALSAAESGFSRTPWILQRFHKGSRFESDYYDFSSDQVRTMEGRVRLCPYYFVVGDQVELGGILATLCPLNKKAIHGMVDAVMAPAARK